MTCRDCIHYEICTFHLTGNEWSKCFHFKNKADVWDDEKTSELIEAMAGHEQIKWERDLALQQLESYGIGFGEKGEIISISKAAKVLAIVTGIAPCEMDGNEWLFDCCECIGYCGEISDVECWEQYLKHLKR